MTDLAMAEPAWFPAMHGPTIRLAQLQYAYTGSVQGYLREQVALPARLETAVMRRQVDYLAGRLCARRALCAAGFEGQAEIATDGHGAPTWPEGYRGSISHCEGMAVAVAGRTQHVSAVGVDVEHALSAEVTRDIRRQFASDEELAMSRDSGMSVESWLTVLFSGKESLFKALHPDVGRYFDFLDASATQVDARDGSFTLTLRVTLSKDHAAGKTYLVRFQWSEGVVMTLCQLDAAKRADRSVTATTSASEGSALHEPWNGWEGLMEKRHPGVGHVMPSTFISSRQLPRTAGET